MPTISYGLQISDVGFAVEVFGVGALCTIDHPVITFDGTATFTIGCNADDLKISKTDSLDPVIAGSNLTYTAQVDPFHIASLPENRLS